MNDSQVAELRNIVEKEVARASQTADAAHVLIHKAPDALSHDAYIYNWGVQVGQETQAMFLLTVLDRITREAPQTA